MKTRVARRSARIGAVQALYQMELTGGDAETVAQEFLDHRFQHEPELARAGEPDEDLFRTILRGVPHSQVEIDRAVTSCLSSEWKLSRVDSILRAILRASAYELLEQRGTPARVVIDEYLDITAAFFGAQQRAFVNAVLDKLARTTRAAEFDGVPRDDQLPF